MITIEQAYHEAAQALSDGRTLRTEKNGTVVIWVHELDAMRVLGIAGHAIHVSASGRAFTRPK